MKEIKTDDKIVTVVVVLFALALLGWGVYGGGQKMFPPAGEGDSTESQKAEALVSKEEPSTDQGEESNKKAEENLSALAAEDKKRQDDLERRMRQSYEEKRKADKRGDKTELRKLKESLVLSKQENHKILGEIDGLKLEKERLEAEAKERKKEWEQKMVQTEKENDQQLARLREKVVLLEKKAEQAKKEKEAAKAQERSFPQVVEQLSEELKKLESRSGEDLAKLYAEVKKSSGADSRGRVYFSSGVADLSEEGLILVDQMASEIGRGSSVLVVGFADQSGGRDMNKEISFSRASAVANALKKKLAPDQKIKAVYLGETARFGEKKKNRVVEVWEIAP